MKGKFLALAAVGAVLAFGLGMSATAWAAPADTTSSIEFDPPSPVVEGTLVDVIGTVLCAEVEGTHCDGAAGDPVTVGTIRVRQVQDGGVPVECAELDNGGAYETVAEGTPNGSGQITYAFDTSGKGGDSFGFQTFFTPGPFNSGPNGGGLVKASKTDCTDIVVLVADDPFPDGAITYTQGRYGASPSGEAVVELLIDEPTCLEIKTILDAIDELEADYDCDPTDGDEFNLLAYFLTGPVGSGGEGDERGFLPSGFEPGQNLAAQKITLLLNLNLGFILVAPDISILSSYFLNIDALEDVPSGIIYDPILTTGGKLGTCTDSEPDGECDGGTVARTPLGDKVLALDETTTGSEAEGTTVAEILVAADALIVSGDAFIDVNDVTLTIGDMTDILGLINESYDEGDITGFVTLFDAD